MGRRSDHSREELYGLALEAAERIVEAEGLKNFTVRKVASEIGYSHGTLYNIFADLDDLIVHLNGRTLDALYQALKDIPLDGGPEMALARLGKGYIAFTRHHRNRWNLLFEHHLPNDRELPEWHYDKVLRLLALVEAALSPLFPHGKEKERVHSARVLWSALHGICSLEGSRKLAKHESVEALSKSLIAFYIGGLTSAVQKGRYE
jgi:AcrR family transcriptional regulator